jgi:hypothetical protein
MSGESSKWLGFREKIFTLGFTLRESGLFYRVWWLWKRKSSFLHPTYMYKRNVERFLKQLKRGASLFRKCCVIV